MTVKALFGLQIEALNEISTCRVKKSPYGEENVCVTNSNRNLTSFPLFFSTDFHVSRSVIKLHLIFFPESIMYVSGSYDHNF